MDKELIAGVLLAAAAVGLSAAVVVLPALRRVYLFLFFVGVTRIVDINFVSREEYRGWVRGFELGTQDVLLAALFASVLLGWARHRPRLLPPLALPMLLYLFFAVISVATALVPLYAAFGLLKLVRYAAAFWIVANAVRDEGDVKVVIWALLAGAWLEHWEALTGYARGVYRARGTFSHSNTLGMYLNMILPIVYACLLNLRSRARPLYLATLGVGAGVVVLTLSRGSWVALGLAILIVTPLSLLLRLRPDKLAVLGLIAVLATPPGVFAVQKMIRRVREAPESSGEARVMFNQVAREMAADRAFGVGVNNYSEGTDGPYSEPFGDGLDRGGLCHNLYYLTVGELGWGGLAGLLAVLATAFFRVVAHLVRRPREDLRTVLMIGWLGGLATVALQSSLEWAMLQTALAMTFYGLLGVTAAVTVMPAGAPATRYRVELVPAQAGGDPSGPAVAGLPASVYPARYEDRS